jgi:D-amino-acid oxidase
LARDLPGETALNYASPWAGAHYRPVPGDTPQLVREAAWAKRSFDKMREFAFDADAAGGNGTRAAEAGVLWCPGEEFIHHATVPGEYAAVASDAGSTAYGHLPSGVEVLSAGETAESGATLAFRYGTYVLNTPLYLSYLLRRVILLGGHIQRATLSCLPEAFALLPNTTAVLNCSGLGFSDPHSFIIRGQTCLVRNAVPRTITHQLADGSWSFCIPRPNGGGTIIGGTKQPRDYNAAALPEIRAQLLGNATRWFPFAEGAGRGEFSVIADIVGRRPAREGGARVETERVAVVGRDGAETERPIVHAYGLAGRGVELSWGVAEDAVKLLLGSGVVRERAQL